MLGTYIVDETANPVCDLDDPHELVARALRPTQVAMRNRTLSQRIARDVWAEDRWAGIGWWSYYRPQWQLHAYWRDALEVHEVAALGGHAAVTDAAYTLHKELSGDLGR